MTAAARWLLVAAAALALVAPGAASASSPLRLGPFTDSYDFVATSCPGFDVRVQGTETFTVSVYFDEAGGIERVVRRDSAPHDILTNTVTGASIVVRAQFDETMTPIPGTDEATKTVVGFRYLVDEPGEGAIIRDVGRITYGDFEQTVVLWEAGEHDLALEADFDPTFCAALS